MAKDIKFNIIDGNFRILSLCLYFCGRVGVLLAPFHFAAHSHSLPRAVLCNIARANLRLGLCSPFRLRIPIPLPRAVLHELRRMCQAAPVFPVPKLPVPEQGSALSVPIRKTPDFCQAHSASHVTWLGFCSLRFTSLRIPFLLLRAVLHDLRRMCQAAPVFPVPKLPVPEQGSALSVPIRKTPDFCQAHSAFHVTWLGFCSLRFTSLRIPIPLPRAIFATFRYACTSVAGLGFCSLRFTSLRIPIPIPCRGLSYNTAAIRTTSCAFYFYSVSLQELALDASG